MAADLPKEAPLALGESDDGSCLGTFRQSTASEGTEFLTLDFSPNREIVNRWKKLPDCDEFVGARRSKHTMVAYKNGIYVFGGDNSKQMLNDIIRFDLTDYSWSRAFTMGVLPSPRYHHSAVVYESSMYIFGGYTGDIHSNVNLTNKNDLFEYKFSTGQWSEIRCEGKLPHARSAHGAAVHDGKMWIFGGFDGHTRLNDMWCIGLAGPVHRWQEVQQCGDCPPICCNFALTVIKDDAYLFSGQSGARSTNSLFQFNFPSRTWTKINTEHILRGASPPPPRRYGHTMVAHDRHMYVFGGAAENIHSADLHCYDLDTHSWSVVKSLSCPLSRSTPSCRLFHAAVVFGDAMFVFGGTVDNNVRSSEMFRFQFSSYPRCTLHDDFGRLLESRQFCDLRFLVGKDSVPIYAHIAIVAARSVFLRNKIKQARELAHHMHDVEVPLTSSSSSFQAVKVRENNVLDVVVPDAEPFAFEMILDYIYTDRIDPTHRGQEPMSNGVVLLMMDVYRLSLQFAMKRLENLCVQYLESMIGLRNVLVALQNASRLNLRDIKEYCLKYVIREGNYNNIVMSKEFETLEQPLMVEIIRRRQSPTMKSVVENNSVNVDGPTLVDDMKTFLEFGSEFCDVTLVCENISFPVHKVILAARAGYFEALFRSWLPESNTVSVSLGEVKPSAQSFRSLLRYIYYGETTMSPEDSLYLLCAPLFYVFTNNRLQAYCKENLETNIQLNNVLELLEAADKLQANEMKRHALKLIVNDFSKLPTLPKLHSLSRDLLEAIIIEAATQGTTVDVGQQASLVSSDVQCNLP